MRLVWALLAVLATSCAAQPDSADPAVVLQQVLASHQSSLAGIAPRPASAGGEGSVAPVAGTARPARRPAGGLPTMAGQLVGQAPGAVIEWFGEPRLRREEGSAEIWHYQAPQCHLDLVFYRDEGAASSLQVAFASARAVGTSRRGEAACLRDIASGQLLTPDDPDAATPIEIVPPLPPPAAPAPVAGA